MGDFQRVKSRTWLVSAKNREADIIEQAQEDAWAYLQGIQQDTAQDTQTTTAAGYLIAGPEGATIGSKLGGFLQDNDDLNEMMDSSIYDFLPEDANIRFYTEELKDLNDDYRRSVADTWNMTSLDKGELFLDLLETYAKQKLMFEEAGLEYEPFQSPLKEPWQKVKSWGSEARENWQARRFDSKLSRLFRRSGRRVSRDTGTPVSSSNVV